MVSNKIRFCILIVILMAGFIVAGCGRTAVPGGGAGLAVLPADALVGWNISARLQSSGNGNTYRAVAGAGLGASNGLELATGADGVLVYSMEMPVGPAVAASWRLEFLSTQGTGRIQVAGVAEDGSIVASHGWVYTGAVPASSPAQSWLDVRYAANYTGDWIAGSLYPGRLPQLKEAAARIIKYRLTVEVGQGQHAIITQFGLTDHPDATAVSLSVPAGPLKADKGQMLTVSATISNKGQRPLREIKVSAVEPFGLGIICTDGRERFISDLAPGEVRTLTWRIRASRADTVNLGQAWRLGFVVNDIPAETAVPVAVQDSTPGKVYYVMTEDLEPIDSAGYATAWGNANGWLDPQEYLVQMIKKPEALDRIAERSGAKWTHYIAWQAVLAAEWASRQSSTGAWQDVVSAIRESVQREAGRGHEYALHLHMDYDPDLPGNVLSYNAAQDGLWGNHLRHGWAHSLNTEGTPGDAASRTGSLYKYQSILDELSRASGQGQLITARAGSFDFGGSGSDQVKSSHAFRAAGLHGSSDADGNLGGVTAAPYGKEIYLAGSGDINRPVQSLEDAALVEFRPTPQQFINYDRDSATRMNALADAGMKVFAPDGRVSPGVHAIVGFTHAMFMLGDSGWTSVEGGRFQDLDEHLGYLKERYVAPGQLVFGTAGDLVREYLDYYSPVPVGLYGAQLSDSYWRSEYAVQILGHDIPIDSEHPAVLRVKYPLYLRQSAFLIQVCKNSTVISSVWGLPTPENDIEFQANEADAVYSIRVWHNETALRLIRAARAVKAKLPWFGK